MRLPTTEKRSSDLRDHLRMSFERKTTGSMNSGKPIARIASVGSMWFCQAVQTMKPSETAISNGACAISCKTVRIARCARHQLPDVNPTVELHGLRVYAPEKFAPDVAHGLHPRPGEAIVIEEHQPETHQGDERHQHDNRKQKRESQRLVITLHLDAELRRPLPRLAIFLQQALRLLVSCGRT